MVHETDLNKLEQKLVYILRDNGLYKGIERYNIILDKLYKNYSEDDDEYDVIKYYIDSIKRMDKYRAYNSPKLRGLKGVVSEEYYNFLRRLNMWDVGYIHCAIVVYLVINYDDFSEDLKNLSAELIYRLILEDDEVYSCLCDNEGNRLLDFKELLNETKIFRLESFLIDESRVTQNTKEIYKLLNEVLIKDNVLLVVVICLLNILKRNMNSFVGNIKVKDEINDFKNEIISKVLVKKIKIKYKDNYNNNSRGWWD